MKENLFAIFAMITAISFIPSLLIVHIYSYKKGYSNGREDEELHQSFERRKALVNDSAFHGMVLESIRENLGEDEL